MGMAGRVKDMRGILRKPVGDMSREKLSREDEAQARMLLYRIEVTADGRAGHAVQVSRRAPASVMLLLLLLLL